MNTKLITEIKKNAFIVVLDEADTSEQEIEKLFNYAESKNYRIFFHHGIKTEKVFVLFNPTLKHVEVLPYEPVNSLLSVPRITIQEFFKKRPFNRPFLIRLIRVFRETLNCRRRFLPSRKFAAPGVCR